MSEDNGAGKPMGGHVFISHVLDDPDWPQAQIEAVADAIRSSGMAVRMERWKQPEGMRSPSVGAWKTWVDEVVIGAERIVCLVSPSYEKCWKERTNGTVEGLTLEGVSVVSFVNQDRSAGRGRLITLRQKDRDSSAVPEDFLNFPSFKWPTDRDELISWSPGKVDPRHVQQAVRILQEMMFANQRSAEQLSSATLHLLEQPDVQGLASEAEARDVSITPEPEISGSDTVDDIGETPVMVGARGIPPPGVATPRIEAVAQPVVDQSREIYKPSTGLSGMLPAADEWRAPVGDFPPPWASAWGDDVYGLWADLTVNGVTQRMRWIEPSGPEGFWMGSTEEERAAINDKSVRDWANMSEHEPKRVVIAQGFWLADTPCTQAFWHAVTGKNPSHFSKGRDAPERPVENVSWNDVSDQFVKRFAQTLEWGTGGLLCLPTEEEWEYAARAGTRSAYWWGDAWDGTRGNADVTGKRRWDDTEGTTPVYRHVPNPRGLFDMHGNVWEWCSSPWRPRRDAPEARPDEDARVVLGGSWFSRPGCARAAFRSRWPRWDASLYLGFRFALRSPAGPKAR